MTLSRGSPVLKSFFFTDYILAYEVDNDKDAEWQQKREEKRREFEANLEKANLELEAEGIEVRVHVTCTLYSNPYTVNLLVTCSDCFHENLKEFRTHS